MPLPVLFQLVPQSIRLLSCVIWFHKLINSTYGCEGAFASLNRVTRTVVRVVSHRKAKDTRHPILLPKPPEKLAVDIKAVEVVLSIR